MDYQKAESYHLQLQCIGPAAYCQTVQVPQRYNQLRSFLEPAMVQHVDNTVKKATNSLNFLRQDIQDCPPRVKGQCNKTLVRPTMEYELDWDPLQELRQHAKATMFYRIVYGLVWVPSTPFFFLDPYPGQYYKRSQHDIPCTTVVCELTHALLFSHHHKDMESTTTAGCLSAYKYMYMVKQNMFHYKL